MAPCHDAGVSGPPSASSSGIASRAESGTAMILGTARDSLTSIRLAPSTEAQPGVSGSPGTIKS